MNFEVNKTVNINTEVFWEMTACGLVVGYQVRRAASDMEVLKAVFMNTIHLGCGTM
jgi:hypothetical protein